MNIKQLVAAVTVLAATGAAFAEARPVDTPFVSTKTRAEVRAEVEQARAEGLLMTHGERDDLSVWDRTRIGATGVTGSGYSGRTRAEVRAEAIEHMKTYKPGFDEMYGR